MSLKFANLTFFQKRFIVAAMTLRPELKINKQITLKEGTDVFQNLYKMRNKKLAYDPNKVGEPLWLYTKNKVSRGVYGFPVPSDHDLNDFNEELKERLHAKEKLADKKATKVAKKAVKKVAKIAKKKAIKKPTLPAPIDTTSSDLDKSHLQSVIDESEELDTDVSSDQVGSILKSLGTTLGD